MDDLRLANGLIGSTNKEVHFLTSRYSPEDLHKIPEAEVFIQPGGDVLLSGIDPILWQ
jgi:anaerobic ribonucleoside-triphosphate reductase activating protein